MGKHKNTHTHTCEGFQALPCATPTAELQAPAPAPVRALHSFKDKTITSLFWLAPEGSEGGCAEGLTYRVERYDATGTWVEVVRDLVDPMYRLDSMGKFAVIA